MAERISTRTYCNDIAPGTFSTELSRCTTYAEIVNSGTIAIVPEPALSYADTKRCTAQNDLTTAGRDVVVHIKNSSNNAATTAGKITFYITGIQAAVYGSSISNLVNAPGVQAVTINSANEFTVTIKADSSNKIAFGFSSPAKKYCQKCYNYTVTTGGITFAPWETDMFFEPMTWSNTTASSQSTTYNLHTFDITETDDVYIFLAQNSQIKETINVYLKSITYVKGTGLAGSLGTPMECKMKNINIGGVTKFTTETTFALLYPAGGEYLLGTVNTSALIIASFSDTTAKIRKDSENPNGTITQRWEDVLIYTSDPSASGSLLLPNQSITNFRQSTNLDIPDRYLELYAKPSDEVIIVPHAYINFDTESTGQWIRETTKNPDKNNYTCYKSNSNKGVSSSVAKARIKFKGYTTITFYIRSYAETTYDYTAIGKLNTTLSGTYSSTYYPVSTNTMHANIYSHTRGKQTSSYTSLTSHWTEVTYSRLTDTTEYYIDVAFCKDGSQNSNDDCGYILIPQPEPSRPTVTYRDVYIYFLIDNCIFYQIRLDFQGGAVDILTPANAILYSTNVLQLQYYYTEFAEYFDPQTGGYATRYKSIAFAVGSNHLSTASKINMQYNILVSQRGGPQVQWNMGYGITPSRLRYVNLTKATYGRDGSLISLGNEVWYAVMTIDGTYTGL